MNLPCNCFGIATAARVPVKRYNSLVPNVFKIEKKPPVETAPGPAVDRGIKKLCEYLEHNEDRIPKVSRRLARQLGKDLRARNLGRVRVSTQAYRAIIDALGERSACILAQELILDDVKPHQNILASCSGACGAGTTAHTGAAGSVVGRLLDDGSPYMASQGAQLLESFIACQSTARFLRAVEEFVPRLCRLASPRDGGSRGPTTPSHDDPTDGGASWRAARTNTLAALLGLTRLCSRLGMLCGQRVSIIGCTLACLAEAQAGAVPEDAVVPRDILCTLLSTTKTSHGPDRESQAAAFRYLDEHSGWGPGPTRDAVLAGVRQAWSNALFPNYLVFRALFEHLPSARGSREALAQLALDMTNQLESGPTQVAVAAALSAPAGPEQAALVLALTRRVPSSDGVLQALAAALAACEAGSAAGAPQEPDWGLLTAVAEAAPGASAASPEAVRCLPDRLPLRAASTPSALRALAKVAGRLPAEAGRKLARALAQAALSAPVWPEEGTGEGTAPAPAAVDGTQAAARCGLLAVAQRCAGPLGLPELPGLQLGVWLDEGLDSRSAANYSAEDEARAAEMLAAWHSPLPAEWAGGGGSPKDALKLPKLFLAPEPHGQPPALVQLMPEQEAERLRSLYQGADAFPDDLALAALPSGSFSVAPRRKSANVGRPGSQKVVTLRL